MGPGQAIDTLKARLICPVLTENNWLYEIDSEKDKIKKDIINNMVLWLSRRGGHISWPIVDNYITRKTLELDPRLVSEIFTEIRIFYHKHYLKMVNPVGRYQLKVDFKEGRLSTIVPVMDHGKKVEFILFEKCPSSSLLAKNVKTRLISIWGAVKCTSDFIIKNINLDKDEDPIIFQPTGRYIESSSKVLLSMLKSSTSRHIYPTEEICSKCPHLEKCPV